MKDRDKDIAYMLAKHKAEKLKRFYLHGIIFLIFNTLLILFKVLRNIENGETLSEALFDFSTFSTALIWGLVFTIHAFSVFGPNVILGSDWEERKLKEYIKEEEEQFDN